MKPTPMTTVAIEGPLKTEPGHLSSRDPHCRSFRSMSRLAWGALAFNLFVIVWGAYVRASGSGAGCGSHWPLCNGVAIPRDVATATAIEFTHRVTSGACLILAVVIAWRGKRDFAGSGLAERRVRRSAFAVLGFTLTEALIGAGLVLLGHVAKDQSTGRVISISLHLVNTFILLASLSLTAWWSTHPRQADRAWTGLDRFAWGAIALTVLLAMTGAITALGDTLFRSASLAQGLSQDFSPASHFLLRLRVIHPALAVGVAGWLFHFAERAGARTAFPRLPAALKALVGLQLALGLANLLLLAPTSLQLIHLLVAECLWIALILTAVSAAASTSDFSGGQGATRPC